MTEPPTPPIRRRGRRWLLLLLLPAAALAAGGAVWAFFPRPAPPPAPPEAKGDQIDPVVITAVQVVRQRVLKDPHSALAWGELGEVFLANELDEDAQFCCAEAERLDPHDPRWPYFQAGILLNQGDREAAVACMRRALERGPPDGDASTAMRLRLAETLLLLGQLDEAETHILAAQSRQPDEPRGHFDAALLAVARQKWDAARDQLLPCLGSPFAQRKARVQLAAVCERLGDPAQAEEYRAQAERLAPDVDWLDPLVEEYLHWGVMKRARYRLADNLEAAGRFRDAAVVVRPLTIDYPDDCVTHMTLGKCLAQAGDFTGGEQALRRALALCPEKVQTHYYLALLLLKKGEAVGGDDPMRAEQLFREAADLARQAVAVKPDYGHAHMALGLSLKHLGARGEAAASLRQAVRCNPEFAEPHWQLGELLAEDGQNAEARSCLQQALRLAPPGAPWRKEVENRLASLPGGPAPEKPPGP